MTVSLGDIATLITAIVALVSLLLSIYNFYVDRRNKSARLVAKLSNGFLTYGSELSELMALLEVANLGEKAVKITAVEIMWKRRKMVFISGIEGTAKPPFDLQAGDKATFWTPMKQVASSLKKEGCTGKESIKACFRTAVDKEFVSKAFVIDVGELTKSK
ncbi:MAG: hypothetical protein MHPDNHAH_02731 [Anaerolineales bacterium]|nr:hypothetical protein [Anaerolineales bacterium]